MSIFKKLLNATSILKTIPLNYLSMIFYLFLKRCQYLGCQILILEIYLFFELILSDY